MKTIDLEEFKAKKNNEVTVEGLIGLLERDKELIEEAITVTLNKDGEVEVYTTRGESTIKFLGYLEVGKAYLLNSMYE